MLGDVVGKIGRDTVLSTLPSLREIYSPDFTIINGENAAGGAGITPETASQLLKCGVDVITLGNHTWSKPEIEGYLDREPRILRPANYPEGAPGRGYGIFCSDGGVKVGVANLLGRVFLEPLDDPFRAADHILTEFQAEGAVVIFFDFHGEATSEKTAFGNYLDGRASVVVGTHTHVQTADERILPAGTAYITDVGMVGPQNSVIGRDVSLSMQRFTTQRRSRPGVAAGAVTLCGVITDIDSVTGRAAAIERIQIRDIV